MILPMQNTVMETPGLSCLKVVIMDWEDIHMDTTILTAIPTAIPTIIHMAMTIHTDIHMVTLTDIHMNIEAKRFKTSL